MTYRVARMSAREAAAWLGLLRVSTLLPSTLDSHLQQESGLTNFEYGVLTLLKVMPDGGSMSDVAQASNATLSRLSHVCSRLEKRSLVERSQSADDRRVTWVRLTSQGRREWVRATPGHIELARRLVIDPLSPEDLGHLARIMEILGSGLDPDHRFGAHD